MQATTFKYRREIDGLRAIAVLSVIFFHAGIPGFSGGFVGVDVFFVISGYLITGILLREHASDQFSLGRFYERRIRRILPALFFVLLVCIPFGWSLMDPYAFWRLGQGLVGVTLFVSNILFWRTTNYFTATVENPLLHTWSLGVEEQFYILFPLFLALVWRFARRWLLVAILSVALVSLGISQWGVQTGRVVAAFYLIPSRAFELLLGSLVAVAAFKHRVPQLKPLITEAIAWMGMGAITWSTLVFDHTTPFPGWHALVPSVGTALILAFVRQEGALGRLLSLRTMVGIGLISYSAYLWHQPVFAYAHIAGWRPGLVGALFLILASMALAVFSWRYVERPFRNPSFLSRRGVFLWAAISSAAMMSMGVWFYATQGVSSRFTDEEMRWWRFADVGLQSRFVATRFNGLSEKFQSDSRRKILIVGDSYAQDFANVVHESGHWEDAQIRTVYIPVVCQMVDVDQDITHYIAPIDRPTCISNPTIRSTKPLIAQADVVVLASSWMKWSAQLLPQTIANMDIRTDQRLFVVGPKSFGAVNVRQLLAMGEKHRAAMRHEPPDDVLEINTILKNGLKPEIFVDQVTIICGREPKCPVVTEQDELISYDGRHLSKEGAKYIGQQVFERSALANVR